VIAWQSQTVQKSTRLLFSGIAALSVTFFGCLFSKDLKRAPPFFLAVKKKVIKEKLSAAPASTFCCAFTSGVVAEPDDADFCG
jgi:hypothetical protein